ncbi:hypothetical protein ACFE04_001308 [Oxalis oulophora]
MVDLHCKTTKDMQNKSPKLSNKPRISILGTLKSAITISSPITTSSESACLAYEQYLRLPELGCLWRNREFPRWKNEGVLKPALQGLEITFRLISVVLSDGRSYVNSREWTRRLTSLARNEIEIIAALCEDDEDNPMTRGYAPIVDLISTSGVVRSRDSEVWKIQGEEMITSFAVNKLSEDSLLPRLAAWRKSEDVAQSIMHSIECAFRKCPYTLGLGEPNLSNKPNLEYDAVCKPNQLHALKKNPYYEVIDNNGENQILYTTQQVLESWIYAAKQLLNRIVERIESKDLNFAASDCYLLEKIWKMLAEIEELHLLMDPDDFLRLKSQLQIKSLNDTESFCFRSKSLVDITKSSKNLKHNVPLILGVEVDPTGGPRIQDAAMTLYMNKSKGNFDINKVHLLQALQAIESALKTFFFAYKQVLGIVMGSLEARGNRVAASWDSSDSLSQIFLEPTYYPSLDAAKTFLGEYWSHELSGISSGRHNPTN